MSKAWETLLQEIVKDEARKGGWNNIVESIECQTEEVCTLQYVHFIKLVFELFKHTEIQRIE